jgi:pyruvate dehydrogenase E2 component (dihydrolipoamide acetyltransferase)
VSPNGHIKCAGNGKEATDENCDISHAIRSLKNPSAPFPTFSAHEDSCQAARGHDKETENTAGYPFMPINILMPALSPTMTEGNLARWVKKEGEAVHAGDVIAEIETDKATMEVEAVDEGVLGKILVQEGSQGVKVNEIIAVLLQDGEKIDALVLKSAANTNATPAAIPSKEAPAAADKKIMAEKASLLPSTAPLRLFATPLAKRLANEKGIPLKAVKGTGPGGRIVRADIERFTQASPLPIAPSPVATSHRAAAQPSFTIDQHGLPPSRLEAHTTMRKVIARRLTESKQQVPHFYLSVDVELDALLALRAQVNSTEETLKISVNDFIIRASALALQDVPAANASWSEEGVRYFERADVSVAVAIEGGLITPIIRGAEHKRLPQISHEMKDLAARARAGKLKPEEFTGGTFSLSNLGMFGITQFNAILNPPQACILAVGAGHSRAVVKNSALAIATIMTATLSVDHRVVDGAVGAEYLTAFKKRLETPLSLLL